MTTDEIIASWTEILETRQSHETDARRAYERALQLAAQGVRDSPATLMLAFESAMDARERWHRARADVTEATTELARNRELAARR